MRIATPLLILTVLAAATCRAEENSAVSTKSEAAKAAGADTAEVQLAVEKGLFFVERTAMKWWNRKKCASCHEGPMLLFSHNVAKRQGIPVDQKKLDFWTDRWVITDGLVHSRKSDQRKDAGGMVGAPFTLLFRDLDGDQKQPRAKNFGKLMQIAGKDWHHEDGSWDIKVKLDYTPWITMALESYEKSDMPLSEEVRKEIKERRERTEKWIDSKEHPFPEITEDLAAWLVYETHRKNKKRSEKLLTELLNRQRDDGLWGITIESEKGHQLVTATVLFALVSSGFDTTHPVVARTQRLILDNQKEDGRWIEGGRIFDDGSEPGNLVYNMWVTAYSCAALSKTIKLPEGTKPLFVRDAKLVAQSDRFAKEAAKGYTGTKANPEAEKVD